MPLTARLAPMGMRRRNVDSTIAERSAPSTSGGGVALDLLRAPLTVWGAKGTPGRPGFPGERHATMLDGPQRGFKAQFLGPGTAIDERVRRGDPGLNAIDREAKKHDLSYMAAKRGLEATGDRAAFEKDIREADADFIEAMGLSAVASAGPVTARVAKLAMQLKSLGENLGVLPHSVFSGGSEGDPACRKALVEAENGAWYPDARLRRDAMAAPSVISGGFLPALVAPAVPAITTVLGFLGRQLLGEVAGAVAERVFGRTTGRPVSGGAYGVPAGHFAEWLRAIGARDTPRGHTAALLSLFPQGDQVEMVHDHITRRLREGRPVLDETDPV